MSLRHFALLFGVCLVWGLNFVVAKWSLSGTPVLVEGFEGSPPFFFAFLRFFLLYAVLGPWLRPVPRHMGVVIGAALTMGAIQFALLFVGLRYASPSAIAIVVQLAVPFTTVLSIIFLQERVRWVRGSGMAIAFAGAVAALLFAIELFLATRGEGAVISYALGAWQPPVGIEFRVDALNAALLLLLTASAVLALIFALPSVEDEIDKDKRALFYSAFLVVLSGLAGVATTGDAFNMFVFLEISSIPTYALIAMGASHDRRALTSSFNYLVMGTIGATFFVIGVGFLYMATGTLNMADLAMRLPELQGDRVVEIGFAFILVGLGLKAALFPLHLWLPGAYAYAPSFVTTFLAATATKVAFYAIIRFSFDVFSVGNGFVLNSFTPYTNESPNKATPGKQRARTTQASAESAHGTWVEMHGAEDASRRP